MTILTMISKMSEGLGRTCAIFFLTLLFSLPLGLIVSLAFSAVAATSGTCGNNLTFTKSDDGTVTIRGTGAMYDYSAAQSNTDAPWYSRTDVKHLVVEYGPTTIGKNAYLLLSALTKELVTPLTLERNETVKTAVAAVTPLTYVTPQVPPTIVVQGTNDEMIPYQNSVALYEALQSCGVDSVHITYEGAGHFLGKDFPEANAARTAAFEAFAQKYCQP